MGLWDLFDEQRKPLNKIHIVKRFEYIREGFIKFLSGDYI